MVGSKICHYLKFKLYFYVILIYSLRGAGGTTSESTMFLSSYIQNYLNIDVLMHLTCRSLSKAQIDQTLEQVASLLLRY